MLASNFEADGQGQGPNGACDNMDNIVAELRDKLQAVEALPQWQEAGENGDHREQILHFHTMSCPQFARGRCARGAEGPRRCFCYHVPSEKRRPLVDTLSQRLRYWDKMCEFIEQGEQCPYGEACSYAHTKEEVSYHAAKFKTKLCTEPQCCDKKMCCFAHGESELRRGAAERYSYWKLVGGASHGIEGASWNPDMSSYDPAIVAAAGPNPVEGAECVGFAPEQVDRMGHMMNGACFVPQVYKHRFCASYPNVSSCRRGDACAFAHTREDIRLPLLTEDEEEQKPAALTNDFFMFRFKTLWCPVGVQHDWQTCVYAHNYQDARRHPRVGYGPRPCPYWKRQETSLEYSQRCPLGVRCPFSHGAKEQLYHPAYFKTVTCQDSPSGACPRGKLCAFWHKRSQQRARPSTKGLQEEFNYKVPIAEQRMQESLQPDFLAPPFKLLNAVQANMHAMAMGAHQDMMQSDMWSREQMHDCMQGWMPQMCGYADAGTPVTQTTGVDSDEAASSLSGSDKHGALGSADAGQMGAIGVAGDSGVASWGACGHQWAPSMWSMEGQCMPCGSSVPFGACGGPCSMGGGQMMCYMVSVPQQDAGCPVQIPHVGGSVLQSLGAPHQDTSGAEVLIAELGDGQMSQAEAVDGEAMCAWGMPQGDCSLAAQMMCPAGIYMVPVVSNGAVGPGLADDGSFMH